MGLPRGVLCTSHLSSRALLLPAASPAAVQHVAATSAWRHTFSCTGRRWSTAALNLQLRCAGVTGIALGLAGAQVTLTDREHVLHLTHSNVEANCVGSGSSRVQVSPLQFPLHCSG